MTEWWNPATYQSIETLVTQRGAEPILIAISGSGATNTLHDSSDVDIYGIHATDGVLSLTIPADEIINFFGFVDNPPITCRIRSPFETRSKLRLSGGGVDCFPSCWKVWEVERALVYPRIYSNPTRASTWTVAVTNIGKKTIGGWYQRASYNLVHLGAETVTMRQMQMALRIAATGAYYLENNVLLVDAKQLFTWAEIGFDWSVYAFSATNTIAVSDYATSLDTIRARLNTNISAIP